MKRQDEGEDDGFSGGYLHKHEDRLYVNQPMNYFPREAEIRSSNFHSLATTYLPPRWMRSLKVRILIYALDNGSLQTNEEPPFTEMTMVLGAAGQRKR